MARKNKKGTNKSKPFDRTCFMRNDEIRWLILLNKAPARPPTTPMMMNTPRSTTLHTLPFSLNFPKFTRDGASNSPHFPNSIPSDITQVREHEYCIKRLDTLK